MITQLCQPDEWAARLGAYAVGDRVKSIVAADHGARAVQMGDEGCILGPAAVGAYDLMVDFGGDPKLIAPTHFADVCPPGDWAEQTAARLSRLGGLGIGDTVRSLIANPAWSPRPLAIGDEGEIAGPAPKPHDITVCFGGGMYGRLALAQVCTAEQWIARLGPFKRGDRVRARVPADHWRPRSLRIGDIGTIEGPAPPPHEITVNFGGTPPLTGMLKRAEVAKAGVNDADFGQQWPQPLGTLCARAPSPAL